MQKDVIFERSFNDVCKAYKRSLMSVKMYLYLYVWILLYVLCLNEEKCLARIGDLQSLYCIKTIRSNVIIHISFVFIVWYQFDLILILFFFF